MTKHWRGASFDSLMLQTIEEVRGLRDDSNEVYIRTSTGREFRMLHHQDCCESVELIDFDGDENDLVGGVVVRAEKVVGETPSEFDTRKADSYTWTFYKLDTNRGGLTMRWLGESNGYYSEEVSFEELVEV